MNYTEVQDAQAQSFAKQNDWAHHLQYLRGLAAATVHVLNAVRAATMEEAPVRPGPHLMTVDEALDASAQGIGHVGPLVSDYAAELAPLLDSLGFRLVPSATLVDRHTIEPKE